jgi:hypothetical protein
VIKIVESLKLIPHIPQAIELIHFLKYMTPDSRLGVGTGWSGEKTLHTHGEMKPFTDLVDQHAPGKRIEAWANVTRYGQYTAPHNHHQADEVALIYLQVPNDPPRTVFPDKDVSYLPKVGTMLIFSGKDVHEVEVQQTHGERISVAYNVFR